MSAQRNVEAEGMCQPFLTSNFSSPLIPDIRRNLKIDEGECAHACMCVCVCVCVCECVRKREF